MENNDFEVWSMFTDEIESWYDDAGGDPAHYDYVGSYDPETATLTAKLVVFSEDAEEVVEELNKTKTELMGHLASLFPQTKVTIEAVTPAGWEESEESPVSSAEFVGIYSGEEEVDDSTDADEDSDVLEFEYDDEACGDDDDAEARQYEEEGLTLISEDEDEDFTNIIEQETEAAAEDDDAEYSGKRSARDLEELDLEYDDDYEPDDKDREDLWRSFWVSEDE